MTRDGQFVYLTSCSVLKLHSTVHCSSIHFLTLYDVSFECWR